MPVSDNQLGLAEPAGTLAPRPQARLRAPVPPPSDQADLARYLRATAARADADDLEMAFANCGVAIDAAGRWRSDPALAAAYSLRASVGRRMGRLAGAERDGELAGRMLAEELWEDAALLLRARRVSTRLDVGDLPGAEKLLIGFRGELPDTPSALALRYARGRFHACDGQVGEALADLFACGERLAARQADRPGVLPWRSAAAAELVATGATEAAARLVAAEVGLARRSGPASALGRALRVEGTVPGGPGIGALDEAVKVLQRSPRRFEYAQALVDLGTALNAARRRPQARRVLREGLQLAADCGSPALVARARSAYLAAGGKPRVIPTQPRAI
jgi:tetratricopeptide (TPR) repeat protein